jgi:predicted Zn-ribbon and HTH transcriptional regulator
MKLTSKIGWDEIPKSMGTESFYLAPHRCHGCGCHMTLRSDQLAEITLCPYCDPEAREKWEGLYA